MIENIDMQLFAVIVSIVVGFTFCVSICLAFFWGRRWATKRVQADEPPACTVPAPPPEEHTKSDFLDSLESAHKRLESVLARAEIAEQKLSRFATYPDAGRPDAYAPVTVTGKPDSYATAAFLLANGEGVDRVARRVNLSPTQVRLVQRLQQELEEKTDAGTEEREERVIRVHKQSGGKNGLGYEENFALGQNGVRFLAK